MVKVYPFQPLRPAVTLAAEVSAATFEKPEHGYYPEIAPTKGLSYKRILEPSLFEDSELSLQEEHQKARENLNEFLENQYLVRENAPSFYVYCQTSGQQTFTGIIGTYSVQEYDEGRIRKHELTRKAKEKAIADYFRNVGVNGSPVMLTFPANDKLHALVQQKMEWPPLYNFVSKDGLHHALWRIQDSGDVDEIRQIFDAMPALYIADGHHRCAAYANYAQGMKNPAETLGMAFMIPDNDIQIHGFHRLLKDLNGWQLDNLLARLKPDFHVEALESAKLPGEPGEMVFMAYDQWFVLRPCQHLYHSKSYKAGLDVYLLEQYILKPFFEIVDVQHEDRLMFVEGTMGLGQLGEKMEAEAMNVAFLLHPIPVDYLMKLADNGETLPPKSTWIVPKLRSGLTVHELH